MTTAEPPALRGLVLSQRDKTHHLVPALSIAPRHRRHQGERGGAMNRRDALREIRETTVARVAPSPCDEGAGRGLGRGEIS